MKTAGILVDLHSHCPMKIHEICRHKKNTSDISLDKFEHVSQPCDVTKIVMVNELELSHHLSVVMSVFSCEKLRNQTIQTQVVGWNVMGFLMQND